jgi:hypothetical protein
MKINYIVFNNGDNTFSIYHYDNGKSTRIDDKTYSTFLEADKIAYNLAHSKN